jgi:NAD(P)H dehydrogenase (quinone)
MKALIILGHPDPGSFNHAIAEVCRKRIMDNGHTVIIHDLYREKFDPVLEKNEIPKNGPVNDIIKEHCRELTECDGIIIIHPNWWGQPPAILKGWIDRVIRPGTAYKFDEGDMGEGIPRGLLRGKIGIVFNTSDTNEKRENDHFKDPLETIWKNCIFSFCGINKYERKVFRIIVTSEKEQRKIWLMETEELIDRYFVRNR